MVCRFESDRGVTGRCGPPAREDDASLVAGKSVVVGVKFFDQLRFQQERAKLTNRLAGLDVGDPAAHMDFFVCREVRADPRADRLALSDIEQLAVRTIEEVNSGRIRKLTD